MEFAAETISQWEEVAESAVGQAESILKSAQWLTFSEEDNVALYTAPTASGFDAVKLEMRVNRPPHDVWKYIMTHWQAANDRLQSDLVEGHEIISTVNATRSLWRQFLWSPLWGVSSRELLLYDVGYREDSGRFVHASASVENEQIPVSERRVRAALQYGTHFIEEDGEGGSRIISVSLGDPKGWLPSFLVNMTVSSRVRFYRQLLRDLEEDGAISSS